MARALRTLRRTIVIANTSNADESVRAMRHAIGALSRLVQGEEEGVAVESLRASLRGYDAALRGTAHFTSPDIARAAILFAVDELEYLIANR